MDTDELAVLVQTVAAGSISGAARRLGITPMIASRRLASLETRMGAQLMHRTTRSVALTTEGEAFLPYARQMLEAEAAGLARLAHGGRGASGLLRVTAPAAFGRKIVAPMIPSLLDANPDLRIELEMTDTVVDIVAGGIDIAIRIGNLRPSSLIARRLASNIRVVVASPAYCARHGIPASLDELARHECLLLTGATHWTFTMGADSRELLVSGRFASSSVEAIHALCVAGQGIGLLSLWDVHEELASGDLVRIAFVDAVPERRSIWAVHPASKFLPAKSRVFVAALESGMARLSLSDDD